MKYYVKGVVVVEEPKTVTKKDLKKKKKKRFRKMLGLSSTYLYDKL